MMGHTEERATVAGLEVRWHQFQGQAAGGEAVSFGMWVLDDPDAMLDALTQEEFERTDERMPYFGLVWPSAEALVTRLLAEGSLDGWRVLDLGCGLGLCGFVAAALGGRVTFFDWEPRALEIVAASIQRQGWPADRFDLAVGDWRSPPPRFGPFDLILGADVLYERRNGPAVAAFVASHLAVAAEAWIADPSRPQAAVFPALAEAAGLAVLGAERLSPGSDGGEITLYRLALRGES